jgi:hypothetical protein
MKTVARMPFSHPLELVREDRVPRARRVVEVNRVGQPAAESAGAQHAHDRRDAAPPGDEQRADRRALRQHEIALRRAEAQVGARSQLADQER